MDPGPPFAKHKKNKFFTSHQRSRFQSSIYLGPKVWMVDRPAPKSSQAFAALVSWHRSSGRPSCILLVKGNASAVGGRRSRSCSLATSCFKSITVHQRLIVGVATSHHSFPPHSRCQTICHLDGPGTWIEFMSRLPSASRGGDAPHESIVSPIVFLWQVKKFHKESASEKTQRTLLFHCATWCCAILPIERTYLMRLTNWHVHLPHLNQHWCAPQPSYGAKFQTGSKLPKQDQSCLVDTIEQKQNKQLR